MEARNTISAIVSPILPLFLVTMNPNGKKSVWSNFEVADMNFWRGPAYTAFFEYLDSKGGFYYEVRFVPTLGL
jgi:hypothetical protein